MNDFFASTADPSQVLQDLLILWFCWSVVASTCPGALFRHPGLLALGADDVLVWVEDDTQVSVDAAVLEFQPLLQACQLSVAEEPVVPSDLEFRPRQLDFHSFALVLGGSFLIVVSVDHLPSAHVADILVVEVQHYLRDVLEVFWFYDAGFEVAIDLRHDLVHCFGGALSLAFHHVFE